MSQQATISTAAQSTQDANATTQGMNHTVKHDPSPGDIYGDDRTNELYEIIYIDKQVALLRSQYAAERGHYHRMEPRKQFDKQVDHGRLSFQPEADIDLRNNAVDWSNVGNIGDKTKRHLHEAGYKQPTDIQQASDEELLNISGIGSASLTNLREYTQ
jgi:hypothetical protein